jgi:four helix bundle protein
MPGSPIENIRVWRESMIRIYVCTAKFPKEEMYGLTSQMRRCALSIPSNIAEGSQRGTDKDFAHFLVMARGSWAELKTQIMLAKDLEYLSSETANELLNQMQILGKQLGSFYLSLVKPEARGY